VSVHPNRSTRLDRAHENASWDLPQRSPPFPCHTDCNAYVCGIGGDHYDILIGSAVSPGCTSIANQL